MSKSKGFAEEFRAMRGKHKDFASAFAEIARPHDQELEDTVARALETARIEYRPSKKGYDFSLPNGVEILVSPSVQLDRPPNVRIADGVIVLAGPAAVATFCGMLIALAAWRRGEGGR